MGEPCDISVEIHCSQGEVPAEKPAMVAGISSIELAKIGGITPEVLIFSGICVESPPNMRLPTWRFGYCTTIRRCARSMNTIKATTATDITRKMMINIGDKAP